MAKLGAIKAKSVSLPPCVVARACSIKRFAFSVQSSLAKLSFNNDPGDGGWGDGLPVWQTGSSPSLRVATGNSVGGSPLILYGDPSEKECKLILVKTDDSLNPKRELDEGMWSRRVRRRFTREKGLCGRCGHCPSCTNSESRRLKHFNSLEVKQWSPLTLRKRGKLQQVSSWDTTEHAAAMDISRLKRMTPKQIKTYFESEPVIYLEAGDHPVKEVHQLLRRLSTILDIPCFIMFHAENPVGKLRATEH